MEKDSPMNDEKLHDKLAVKVEHDELGTYGEYCNGQYECVCDDEFVPYEVLGDFSLEELENLIKSRDQQIALAAQKQTVEILKSRMLKHFTKWGGDQGNCVPEDTLDDYLESLSPTLNQAQKEES